MTFTASKFGMSVDPVNSEFNWVYLQVNPLSFQVKNLLKVNPQTFDVEN